MKITSIRLKPIKNDEKVLATVTVELDDELAIHSLKIIQLKDKRILSFPTKKSKRIIYKDEAVTEGFEYTDTVHPITSAFREYIQQEVFKVYDAIYRGGSKNNE